MAALPRSIPHARLAAQQISASGFRTPAELLHWMGALQAQDYDMVKWATGLRVPGSTLAHFDAAVNKGELIRTHLLRPTWHLVAASDLRWLLELTAPQIKAGLKTRHLQLELDETVFSKSHGIIAKALAGGNHLTREDLVALLKKAKIDVSENRSSHLLLRAELDGLVCSGKNAGKKPTYALLDEWVKPARPLHKDEALARLAAAYFRSHGPATLADFTWWSGLPAREARQALESAAGELLSEKTGSETHWFGPAAQVKKSPAQVLLLPAYDEYLISYRDRSAMLQAVHNKKTISDNGIFYPVIVVDGQVAGTWKRRFGRDSCSIDCHFFQAADKSLLAKTEAAAAQFGKFLGLKTEIAFL